MMTKNQVMITVNSFNVLSSVVEMEDSVSAFIVGTCRTIPKTNTDVVQSIHLKSQNFGELGLHRIVCGSTAEFFIQPLHSCIGDIDMLELKSCYLVFTDENPV